MSRTISLLCKYGDLTFGWDESDDATVLPILQSLLDAQVRFLIVRKKKQHLVTKLTQAIDARNIVLPSEAWQRLIGSGLLALAGKLVGDTQVEVTSDLAKTPEQIAENDVYAVNPVGGG
jgi:hypothetical protein